MLPFDTLSEYPEPWSWKISGNEGERTCQFKCFEKKWVPGMGRKWCENNRVHKLLDYNWQVLSLTLPESFQDQSSRYLLRVFKGLTFCGLCFFSRAGKKRSPQKWGLCFFTGFTPNVWDSVFFQSWNFWTPFSVTSSCMLEPGFWYSFLSCNGIIIWFRPKILKT